MSSEKSKPEYKNLNSKQIQKYIMRLIWEN